MNYLYNLAGLVPLEFFNGMSDVGRTIISVAIMLFSGFALTRLTKLLKLPNVTAYIIAGILIGPYCLGLIPEETTKGMAFLSDIALAIIAFGVGKFFKLSTLKKNGLKVVVITVLEALVASVIVFLIMYFALGMPLAFSLVLAALASATAPASTVMTIKQTGAKGDFVDTLLQVVALDDVVSLVAYSVAISLALAMGGEGGALDFEVVIKPILTNALVIVLGAVFGFILKALLPKKRSTDNRLIIIIGVLFTFCGICAMLDVSPLLGCMVIGTVYINTTDDEKLFLQLDYFSPPILLLFFVNSGVGFNLSALIGDSAGFGKVSLLVAGIVYMLSRLIGKYLGAYIGCVVTKKSNKVRNYLGLALVPQAGVAIGLAALGARTLGGDAGVALQTVILASSVLYEMIGPACSKLALYLSGAYSNKLEEITTVTALKEDGSVKNEVDVLIERINNIREDIREREERANEAEKAFDEAAEQAATDDGLENYPYRRRGFIR